MHAHNTPLLLRSQDRFAARKAFREEYERRRAEAAAAGEGGEEDGDEADGGGVPWPASIHPDGDDDLLDAEEQPFYIELLRNALDNAPRGGRPEPIVNVAINVKHLRVYNEDAQGSKLQKELVRFPSQIIPIFDIVLNEEARDIVSGGGAASDSQGLPPVVPVVRSRVWNLPATSQMRQLDPRHIETLVALRGMVVRTSSIIPEMRRAFYRCAACPATVEVEVDKGRVEDPVACAACRQQGSMELVHNRCVAAIFWWRGCANRLLFRPFCCSSLTRTPKTLNHAKPLHAPLTHNTRPPPPPPGALL